LWLTAIWPAINFCAIFYFIFFEKAQKETTKNFSDVHNCLFQIALVTFALVSVASARPQEYDDYDQPAPRASHQKQHHQQQQQQQPQQRKVEERETSTYIPIIQYDKEQDISGSYKTQYVAMMIN
jgi:hypothetical protein